MAFRNEIKSGVCTLCGTGKIMTGRHQSYNGRVDGKIACVDCVVQDRITKAMNDLTEA